MTVIFKENIRTDVEELISKGFGPGRNKDNFLPEAENINAKERYNEQHSSLCDRSKKDR